MLVQALAAYARNNLQNQLNDVAFEERTVPYFIEISRDGLFVGVTERFAAAPPKRNAKGADTKPGGKLRSLTYSVPRSPVTLTSGIYALLGTGELKYVLGSGAWTEEKNIIRDNDRLQAFIKLLKHAYEETKEEALGACIRFYDEPAQVARAREVMAAAIPGSYAALSVDGQVLTDREPVQAWWRNFYVSASDERAGVEGECLITGKLAPIAPTHPQIRHTTNIGGKAGVALMSFNPAAFRSYGWEQNANSPVSADAALQYTMALNEMLKQGSAHRKDVGGVAFLFWLKNDSRDDSKLDPSRMVDEAPAPNRIAEVEMILRADQSAWLKENIFYMVALSANGSRLIVRSSLTDRLPKIAANVVGWWKGLQMQPFDRSKELSVPRFWQLAQAMERKGDISDDRTALLWNRALGGTERPLGYRIVSDVLGRMRADKDKRIDLAALGLLRLCLNDLYENKGEGEPMGPALDEENPNQHPAFICGRLLALYDYIQWKTFDSADETQPNATVADRFYTLMMNSPAAGLAQISKLGQKHLAKLRRLQPRLPKLKDGGAPIAISLSQRISELMLLLHGNVPSHFGLHDKARFALGFYQQKAFRPKVKSQSEAEPSQLDGDEIDLNTATSEDENDFIKEIQ